MLRFVYFLFTTIHFLDHYPTSKKNSIQLKREKTHWTVVWCLSHLKRIFWIGIYFFHENITPLCLHKNRSSKYKLEFFCFKIVSTPTYENRITNLGQNNYNSVQDSTFFLTTGCRADTNEFLSYTYIFRYSFYLKSLKWVCSCTLLYLFLVIKKALFCSC